MRKSLKELWADNAVACGIWCYINNDLSMEMASAEGCDYVLIDLQHGVADMSHAISMVRAAQFHGANPIIRVPHCDAEQIGKALDGGAGAVMVPMVESGEVARDFIRATCYPPNGIRSIGPIRASLLRGTYDLDVLSDVSTIAMIETVKGLEAVDEIAQTPGLSAIYIGSVDLSISLGLGPKMIPDNEKFIRAIATIKAACDKAGIVTGIHCSNGTIASQYVRQGYRMVTVATDIDLVRYGAKRDLELARS